MRFWLDREQRQHDRAMFDLAIDSKLSGFDLVKIKIAGIASGSRVAGDTGEEAADGMRRPASCLRDLRPAGASRAI